MKKLDQFIVKSLDSSDQVASDNIEDAMSSARLKLMRRWREDKKKELSGGSFSWDELICENFESFQEALSFENVRAEVEDVSIYICSDGAEFEGEDAANEHEFEIGLIELVKKHRVFPHRVARIAQELRPIFVQSSEGSDKNTKED